jgi:peptidase M42 family hydrolase
MAYLRDVLLRLLHTPSPSGRTEDVMRLIGEELEQMGVRFYLTRRGVIVAGLHGQQESPDRAVVVHADTIGCVVKAIKPSGRLQVTQVGHFSARFAEGARVLVFPDDGDDPITGTILPLMASGHTFGRAVDTQGVGWEQIEVRLDEFTESAEETVALGIHVGDYVALEAQPIITPSGFVNSRHLDDKAGVAAALGAFRAVIDAEVELPVSAHLLVTIAEEVGLGASHGLHHDVAEMVSVDNAVVAPGQASRETGVSIAMQDSSGPMDYHLTRKLIRLAEEHGIPIQRDVYNFYRSDAAAALESGAETRAALIGFGVDASHGYERTHLDAIQRTAELVAVYLQTPLTFAWDAKPRGPLEEYPSQEQVAEEFEQAGD